MEQSRKFLDRRVPPPEPEGALHDLRFRALLGSDGWALLPAAVRARFSKRLDGGRAATYVGTIVESRMNRAGWLLAQALRLIGAPLPLGTETGVPAVVAVTEDAGGSGQFWTRLYGRRCGFPQVIHSSKRFAGPTGLEEHIGRGFGIALRAVAEANALHFIGDHYFFRAGIVRLRIPAALSPGALTVSHIDRGDGSFDFMLDLRHAWFGALLHQRGVFRESRVT